MPFIPHTTKDIEAMLETIGVTTIEQLFDEIPENIRAQSLSGIPEGLNEMEMLRFMQERVQKDAVTLNFIGAGAYEHHIPAAVWEIASRGEFMTSYTPYQAEASQGTLQLLYEYQTMMASLTGMDVSNASLYDGASALAEAVLMAVRLQKKPRMRILVPESLHPFYRETVQTCVMAQGIELISMPVTTEGRIDLVALKAVPTEEIAALIIPQPNFFGVLEEVDILTEWAHQQQLLVIGVVNPLSLALLKEPGQWGEQGADIVCGEAQPFGMPLASGGPYAGFLCCKQVYVRQMPGRIIGATLDKEGKRGFTLTLQAREQHIRRSKATSNICTNQGLLITAATIYMNLLGYKGLQQVASHCHENTRQLLDKLQTISGIERVFVQPFFHEVVVRIPKLNEVLSRLSACGILAGYPLAPHYPALKDCLLICVTETKTVKDLDSFIEALSAAMSS